MKTENIHIVEIMGITALVLSLVFVGYELRLSRAIARSEAFVMLTDITIALRDLQTAHTDVWLRGCIGEELSEIDKAIFAKVFQAFETLLFGSWQRANIGITGAPPEIFSRKLALNRYRFAGIDAMWIEMHSAETTDLIYDPNSDAWTLAVEEDYRDIINSNAEKNLDVAFCGQ